MTSRLHVKKFLLFFENFFCQLWLSFRCTIFDEFHVILWKTRIESGSSVVGLMQMCKHKLGVVILYLFILIRSEKDWNVTIRMCVFGQWFCFFSFNSRRYRRILSKILVPSDNEVVYFWLQRRLLLCNGFSRFPSCKVDVFLCFTDLSGLYFCGFTDSFMLNTYTFIMYLGGYCFFRFQPHSFSINEFCFRLIYSLYK